MTKPRWCLGMAGTRRHTFRNLVGHVKGVSDMSSLAAWTNEQFDPRLSWADVEWVKKQWGGKLILKGIMDVEDARLAVDQRRRCASSSATTAAASSTARPAASRRCRPSSTRWASRSKSGWTAASAAARTCSRPGRWARAARMIGRAMVYGLGAMGEAGVTKALQIIHKELDVTMAFCGHTQHRRTWTAPSCCRAPTRPDVAQEIDG